MDQIPFAWTEPGVPEKPNEVALDPETTEALVRLMARALIAVVRGAEQDEEDADER